MTRKRRPPRMAPAPIDLDNLVCPVELLPDRTLPLEERRARSYAREAWYREQGLSDRPGDYVRRRNAESRGLEAEGIEETPKPPDIRASR